MLKTELAIVGAGPAGMSAAETAIDCGMDVTIVDEQRAPGGQIYRQPPHEFRVSNWLSHRMYRNGKALLSRLSENPGLSWLLQSTVSGVMDRDSARGDGRFLLLINGREGVRQLAADAVLIAPGCYDMPAIFPGWNLPGVMAAGAIQAFLKSQQFIPGDRMLFAGSHPLQLIIADQVVKAGGEVAGIIFSQSPGCLSTLLRAPAVMLQNLDKFAWAAAALQRLLRAGVPLMFSRTVLQANGHEFLQSVTTAPVGRNGEIRRDVSMDIECDRLGVCFSFLASSELVRQAGADCNWDTARGGWIATHDEWMCSSLPGIYVAGEITGVAGADVAVQEGRLAAIGCAAELGKISMHQASEMSRSPRRKLQRLNRFARLLSELSWPGSGLLDQLVSESANLCKCEEVTVGAFLQMLRQNPHISTASAAKLLSRAGMGLCQGRYCQHSVIRLMTRHLGIPEGEIGGFSARFPAKPVELRTLVDSRI